MRIILSHPTGNANVKAAAGGLRKSNLLYKFYTSIASFPGDLLFKLGALGPFKEIHRRRFDISLKPVIKVWPWLEIGRLFASRLGFKNLIKHESGVFCVDAVYHGIDSKVANYLKKEKGNKVNAVYAYEDGALATFRAAKQLKIQCYYDLPIGYWRTARKLLENEKERWPEWSSTLTGFKDSEQKLLRKDEELELADRIFVASSFTAETLTDFPGQLVPIEVIPYGFPPIGIQKDYSSLNKSRPLKLLFVGGLSQRKGIADLFAAVDAIGKAVELTVVGKGNMDCAALKSALVKHKWIPSLPHSEILKLMRGHDVLVFPSLFEGFGLVITEAMSQGTPVITTERTAGPDLIRHGENGWLIEAGSTIALQNSIESLLARPEIIAEVGCAAMETADNRPWEVYGSELVRALSIHN
ncbi:MAG: glycosyltransferase family 4 protein [Cytophagaceae bacterium]